MGIEFLSCGDTAILVQFADRIDRRVSQRVMALHIALRCRNVPGIVETVPTFRSLMVHYDPLQTSQAALKKLIEPMAEAAAGDQTKGTHFRLPVCYDRSMAPDLLDVARMAGISPQTVADLHSQTIHYVYMLGFAPGQPYMGDLPRELDLPRRKDPRGEVPMGTIAIATGLTVVYPFANPCGWHAIGRTPVAFFDQNRSPSNLISPGDTMECYPISVAEFDEYEARIAAGDYQIEKDGT